MAQAELPAPLLCWSPRSPLLLTLTPLQPCHPSVPLSMISTHPRDNGQDPKSGLGQAKGWSGVTMHVTSCCSHQVCSLLSIHSVKVKLVKTVTRAASAWCLLWPTLLADLKAPFINVKSFNFYKINEVTVEGVSPVVDKAEEVK